MSEKSAIHPYPNRFAVKDMVFLHTVINKTGLNNGLEQLYIVKKA
jgi:hypothetical protein